MLIVLVDVIVEEWIVEEWTVELLCVKFLTDKVEDGCVEVEVCESQAETARNRL